MCLFKEHLTTPPANICIRYANTRARRHYVYIYTSYYYNKESYGGVVTLLWSRRNNPLSLLSLSVFFQNKRQQNGHEKEKNKNNFYASIYRKNKGGHVYTIIFLSIFFYFLCRRTKKRIIQINTHQQLAAHIFCELWIEVVGLDCYSHYINPIFCGQRFFFLSFFFILLLLLLCDT